MKTLNRISALEQYGLEYLTGEACALLPGRSTVRDGEVVEYEVKGDE
jgi:hypothetical protein